MTQDTLGHGTEFVEIVTTLASEASALEIAKALVTQRLAGCVQILGPITSVYRWQGSINTEPEYRLSVKSTRKLASRLVGSLESMHPYEVPEILLVPVEIRSESYACWLREQLVETT